MLTDQISQFLLSAAWPAASITFDGRSQRKGPSPTLQALISDYGAATFRRSIGRRRRDRLSTFHCTAMQRNVEAGQVQTNQDTDHQTGCPFCMRHLTVSPARSRCSATEYALLPPPTVGSGRSPTTAA